MKKIITYKKDNGTFIPMDSFFNDKEKIEQEIINKQKRTKLNTLPLSISWNSLKINLKKFPIILIQEFYNYLKEYFDDLLR